MAGKGDKRRPRQVHEKVFAENYENVFGKKHQWWETAEHSEWVKKANAIKKLLDKSNG